MATVRAWKETGTGQGKSQARLEDLTQKEPSHPKPGTRLWWGWLPQCPPCSRGRKGVGVWGACWPHGLGGL